MGWIIGIIILVVILLILYGEGMYKMFYGEETKGKKKVVKD